MLKEFLQHFAQLVVKDPDSIKIEIEDNLNDNQRIITIYAKKSDIGRLIGKEGKMINSLKTFISGCRAKEDISYKITILPIDE